MSEVLINFPCRLLVFAVENQNYALDISFVQRVVPIVEITPLPGLPSIVAGVVNIEGEVVPVIPLRRCCGIPERGVRLSDRLIILTLERRRIALCVDEVLEVRDCDKAQWIPAEEVLSRLKSVEGVFKDEEELLILQNPEGYLSRTDHDLLDSELLSNS
ncbi:MAG: Chemotaxis protein CheW [Syntrophus sp. PtaU1.Bin208]|nr:MAG: Chemotaxis protein CheW [Syntrophus sp. PtaU1.Bin208]